MNIAIPLGYVLLMLVTFGLLCYAIGAAHISNWLLGDHQRVDTNLRLLYYTTGYSYPDDATELEPAWWRRAWDRLRGMQATTVMGAQAVDEAEACSDCGRTLTQPDEHTSGLCLRCLNGPLPAPTAPAEHEPDPLRDTGPIIMPPLPGPETQPDLKQAAQVGPVPTVDADWETRSQQMLAEARAAIAEIGGGR